MVTVTEAKELRERFLKALAESRREPRKNISVSELVYCLREAYFNRVFPKPPTETQLGFFVDGARRHKALQDLGIGVSEAVVERFGVHGHIDILREVPIEFKSTRSRQGIPSHYIRQLAYYCVLTMQPYGYLVIQRLMPGATPWEFYKVEFTKGDTILYTEDLTYRANLLADAVRKGDLSLLPRLSGEDAWKCRNCSRRAICGADT